MILQELANLLHSGPSEWLPYTKHHLWIFIISEVRPFPDAFIANVYNIINLTLCQSSGVAYC